MQFITKIIGFTVIIAAIAGLVICIGGTVAVWMAREPLATGLTNTFDLLGTTLKATTDGLTVADQSLSQATNTVTALENTIRTMGKAVGDSVPLVDSLSILMGKDLPDAILATQSALTSAQSSAKSVESTLTLITAFPLLPFDPYQPEVPLTEALGEVSISLDPIPQSFAAMEGSLQTSKGNMTMLSAQVAVIANNVGELKTNLADAQKVLSQYQTVLGTLQQQIDAVLGNLPQLLNIMVWVLTVIFVWLGLTQVGLLYQGFEMVGAEGEKE
jgi:methyl-accepting chemotaxis protein